MADAPDSSPGVREGVRVRVPPLLLTSPHLGRVRTRPEESLIPSAVSVAVLSSPQLSRLGNQRRWRHDLAPAGRPGESPVALPTAADRWNRRPIPTWTLPMEADGLPGHRQRSANFVRWAVTHRHASRLTAPSIRWQGPTGPLDQERSWTDARRLLHDDTCPLVTRTAGLLVLLYAQKLSDITALTVIHVRHHDDRTFLHLGSRPYRPAHPRWTFSSTNSSPSAGHREVVSSTRSPSGCSQAPPGTPADRRCTCPAPTHPRDHSTAQPEHRSVRARRRTPRSDPGRDLGDPHPKRGPVVEVRRRRLELLRLRRQPATEALNPRHSDSSNSRLHHYKASSTGPGRRAGQRPLAPVAGTVQRDRGYLRSQPRLPEAAVPEPGPALPSATPRDRPTSPMPPDATRSDCSRRCTW